MKAKKTRQIFTSAVLAAAMLFQTAVTAGAAAAEHSLKKSRVVISETGKGAKFQDSTVIKDGVYVLLRFEPENVNLDGLGAAKINLTISENNKTLYLDQIGGDWDGTTATTWETTYGKDGWSAKEKISTAVSADGATSFDVTESLKTQLETSSTAVCWALHTEDGTGFKITKTSVKLVIEQAEAYTNFNKADESTIEGLIGKYIEGDSAAKYSELEDKSFVNGKMLERTDYTSLEDVEQELLGALTAYYIDLINKADESTIGGLLEKYLSDSALAEYKKLPDKSDVDADMAARNDYTSIAEIEQTLSEIVTAYNKSHAYLNEEGWVVEYPAYGYGRADKGQSFADNEESNVGAYNNSTRPLFMFDLRGIDLDKAKSIKVQYKTLESVGTWYTYQPTSEYTTYLYTMHSNWKISGMSKADYNKDFFDGTIAATTTKTDMGTYGLMTADVTADVKTRGKGADFISYNLAVATPAEGFDKTLSYIVNKNCDIKMLVEYPNDAESGYSANISDGDGAVSVDEDIVITLPKAVNEESATKDNIVVTENGREISTYKLTVDGATITITIEGGMKYGTDYAVKLKSNLMLSGDGNHYYFAPLSFKTDVEDFENDGLTVLCDGAEVDTLEGVTGTVTAKTRLKNNKLKTPQKLVVTLILIEETEYGDVMKAVKVEPLTLSAGDEAANVSEQFTLSGGVYRIECMVWDSFSGRVTKSAESLR